MTKDRNGGGESSKADNDNHANQLNPNNDNYYLARRLDGRPEDWDDD